MKTGTRFPLHGAHHPTPHVSDHAPEDEPVHDDVAFDRSDVKPSAVLQFLLYLALSLVVTCAIAWGALRLIESRTARFDAPPSPLRQGMPRDMPPEPRLQGVPGHTTDPQQDLRDMRSKDEKDLNSYGWADEKAGIARIPVKEAMKIIAEKGLPSQESKQSSSPARKK